MLPGSASFLRVEESINIEISRSIQFVVHEETKVAGVNSQTVLIANSDEAAFRECSAVGNVANGTLFATGKGVDSCTLAVCRLGYFRRSSAITLIVARQIDTICKRLVYGKEKRKSRKKEFEI